VTDPQTGPDLLLGLLALQMNFVSRDALLAAVRAWTAERTRPLGDLLVSGGVLTADRRALVEALLAEHVRNHGSNPARSLAALRCLESVRPDLAQLGLELPPSTLAPAATQNGPATQAPSSPEPLSTGSRFVLLRPYAQGGLGQVSVAFDRELQRQVALKEIRDERADDAASRTRFLREARITGGLEHPGIVPVYSLGSAETGRPYYAMRLVEGESLHDAIKRFHALPGRERALALRQLLARFLDVCQAAHYAHSKGIVHRDIKPENVLLGPYGETLLVD
jgi:eukaryotic-like serine/threonine-protein kinase